MAQHKNQTIYQLNVALQESSPLIWRRIQVPSQMTLSQLHRVLQIIMRWDDYHLHEFRIGDKVYAEPDPEDHHLGRNVADERRVRVQKLLPGVGSSCEYIYDFGDNWRHDIMLESILPVIARKRYPVCLAGARSAPPEDAGGMGGYERYLRALFDRGHEDHEEMLAWRGQFDPEYFPITSVNRRLREEFPFRSPRAGKSSVVSFPQSSAPTSFEDRFTAIVRSAIGLGRLPEKARTQIGPDEQIPIPFSARDRELIVEHSFADTGLTERLRLDLDTGKSRIFYFTFDELEDLVECVAAEANHADKRAQTEWDGLYDRIAAVLDDYRPSE